MGENTKLPNVGENTNQRAPLLPTRHPVDDFFVCDIFDAAPKGDMASMEHPIFSISTKPDRRIRRYEHGGNFVEITPSVVGLATVHDRDVLIFCISQLIAAMNRGEVPCQTVRFKAYDLLVATNRGTDGRGYEQLKDAFSRLRGTQISTNIVTGDIEQWQLFGLIDKVSIIRKSREGRMLDVEVTLSEWVFNAIRANEVLTLHRDYFRLRKPLERRLYEIGRKHCGAQPEWKIGLELLRKKCGSASTSREFRRLIGAIVTADQDHGHFPDYSLALDADKLIFRARGSVPNASREVSAAMGSLSGDAYQQARSAAPGWDVYALESEWRIWCAKERISPKRPAGHFVKFCQSWAKKRGAA